ncbi:MAG: Crp/Fnr family transcriptional regulator [Bacteroidaceae bacterium]|nr:Crp/Fnr family transcriptional regulator [Bacteroidaceae bacterium]
MYENLLRLPYFQGMNKNDLTSILDKVKLEFQHFTNNETIIAQGSKCEKFVILMNGEIEAESVSDDKSYRLNEIHRAPHAIEPYSLFGGNTCYIRNYTAKGECDILSVEKSYLFSEFKKHNIFMINMLNIISRRAQALNERIWSNRTDSIEQKIINFVALRAESLNGTKRLCIKMERLGELLDETRINISRTLNNMQEKGLIELSRKEILIPGFEKLPLDAINKQRI